MRKKNKFYKWCQWLFAILLFIGSGGEKHVGFIANATRSCTSLKEALQELTHGAKILCSKAEEASTALPELFNKTEEFLDNTEKILQ